MYEAVIPREKVMTTDLTDDMLVKCISKDPSLFGTLYQRYAAQVYRYLYGRVGNMEDAEDLTAQVFLEAMQSLSRYRPQGHFPAWLFTLARHRLIDQRRKGKVELPLDWLDEVPDQELSPETSAVQGDMKSRLNELLAGLDEDKKELIRLRYAAGLSYAEIGKILGRSEAAVGMSIHRIIQWLKDHWEVGNA